MVRKVAIYTRVSTLDQTIDNQLEKPLSIHAWGFFSCMRMNQKNHPKKVSE